MTSWLRVMVDVPVSGVATKIDAQKARMETAWVCSTFVAITQFCLESREIKDMKIKSQWRTCLSAGLHRGNLQPCCTFRFLASREPQQTKCAWILRKTFKPSAFLKSFRCGQEHILRILVKRIRRSTIDTKKTSQISNKKHLRYKETCARYAQKTNQQRICKKPDWNPRTWLDRLDNWPPYLENI